MYKLPPLCHFIRKIAFKSPHRNLGDLTTTICIKTASFPILAFHTSIRERRLSGA